MGLFSKLAKSTRKGIPGRDSGGGMGSAMARPAPRPTLVQGGPAYFTPEGYTPPMQPQQAFMPTDTMGDPIGDMFRAQTIRKQLPKLPPDDRRFPPPRDIRDEFISIGGVGGRDGREERIPAMPSVDETPMNIDRPMISGLENPNLFNFDFSNIDMDAINQRIADAGISLPTTLPAPTPIDIPAQPRIDAIREARGMPPRITDDFMSIERLDEPKDEFIPSMPNEDPIPFIPPVIPQTPVAPPINIGGPPLDTSLIPQREILERPIIPPRRDDFMSIERIDEDPRIPAMINEDPIPFTPPIMPQPIPMVPDLPEIMPELIPMPMQPRMPMPAPIAAPIPSAPMPMAPVDLPRLELPKINRMDRMNVMDRPIPMMPRMGGRGRR